MSGRKFPWGNGRENMRFLGVRTTGNPPGLIIFVLSVRVYGVEWAISGITPIACDENWPKRVFGQ